MRREIEKAIADMYPARFSVGQRVAFRGFAGKEHPDSPGTIVEIGATRSGGMVVYFVRPDGQEACLPVGESDILGIAPESMEREELEKWLDE